jgi:enamine deaminase RidA (YjgF/YER057c/UK114 family)
MQARLERTEGESGGSASLVLESRSEHVTTVCGRDGVVMEAFLKREAAQRQAWPLSRFVFAGRRHYAAFHRGHSAADGCVVWLQGDACGGGEMSSMQAFSVSGAQPLPVRHGGRDIGFVYEDEHARYCRLGGVAPADRGASRGEQTREVFETLDAALGAHGFRFTDTVRTWFFLDRLLEWYPEFNAVRTAFFTERGVFERMVPASTGIGAANAAGAALTCDLLAVQPRNERVSIRAVPSPLQGSAMNYRSSFSRAVELAFPTHRLLMISGTASIDATGRTAHVGDAGRQIELTMQVVTALLQSRGMGWADVTRGIAYFENAQDRPLFERYARDHAIPKYPLAMAHATVCRSDLLFEIEVDAIQATAAAAK